MSDKTVPQLPLWGYINDRLVDGFKTPVFSERLNDHWLQLVKSDGVSVGFARYDNENDRAVMRPNDALPPHYAIVGSEAIYIFKPPFQDIFVGSKQQVQAWARVWLDLQQLEKSDPNLLLDVMMFAGAPQADIEKAISAVIARHKRLSPTTVAGFEARLRRLVARRIRDIHESITKKVPLPRTINRTLCSMDAIRATKNHPIYTLLYWLVS